MGEATETAADPFKLLKISRNPDGTLNRQTHFPLLPPTGEQQPRQSVFSKDVPLDPNLKTWLRIFRPSSPNSAKIPIIIYFHGGGFILFSAATALFDESCSRMATELPAVVVSVEYRLAPENPLPCAYDDAVEAIKWVKNQAENEAGDPWLRKIADFSRCFLMGSSSGGNIVYQAALRVCDLDLKSVRIVGLIMNQPYFGGKERTGSELRLVNDRILPLPANDLMWELALPAGADRDHEFCNPFKAREVKVRLLPRCLVRGHGQDPLVDRQRELLRMLEKNGVEVVGRFDEDGCHGVELFDPHKVRVLSADLHSFVSSTCPL